MIVGALVMGEPPLSRIFLPDAHCASRQVFRICCTVSLWVMSFFYPVLVFKDIGL